jgi:hypothetical protein
MGRPQERLKQAKTVAAGCDRLPETFHGKEEVDRPRSQAGRLNRSSRAGEFTGELEQNSLQTTLF